MQRLYAGDIQKISDKLSDLPWAKYPGVSYGHCFCELHFSLSHWPKSHYVGLLVQIFCPCILFLCTNNYKIFPDVVELSSLQLSSLLFLPTTRLSTCFPIELSSLQYTWPIHLNLSFSFALNSITPNLAFISSFLNLPNLVTPTENLSIFISVTSIFLSCLLVIATAPMPYSISGRTIALYIFPLTFSGTCIFLSQITPVIFFQLYQPLWILFSIFLSLPPSYCTIEPRYLKSVSQNFIFANLNGFPLSFTTCT